MLNKNKSWKYKETESSRILFNVGILDCVYFTVYDGDGKTIANNVRLEDVQLISSAPKLLCVCNEVLAWWESCKYDVQGTCDDEFNVYDEVPRMVCLCQKLVKDIK